MQKYFIFVLCVCLWASESVAETKGDCGCEERQPYQRSSKPDPIFEQQQEGIHVYRDPENGDRVVDVRARRPKSDGQQSYPLYVEPRVHAW